MTNVFASWWQDIFIAKKWKTDKKVREKCGKIGYANIYVTVSNYVSKNVYQPTNMLQYL